MCLIVPFCLWCSCLSPNSSSCSTWCHPNSVICIKRSTPSKDHIIWYQSFGSCYRFYPIQFFFLCNLCLSFVLRLVPFLFASCLCLDAFLFTSCCVLVCVLILVLVLVTFLFLFLFLSNFVSKKNCLNFVTNSIWEQFVLLKNFGGLGFSRPLNFTY